MKRSDDTIQAIKDATKLLLKTKGIITTAEISSAAHVNMAAINYHFFDKEHLISVVVNESISDLKKEITLILKREFQTIEEGLRKFMDYLFEFSMENTGLIKYMLLSEDTQKKNSFVSQFINDKEFTEIILRKISVMTGEKDEEILLCKYILLFSAFLLPLLGEFFFNNNNLDKNLKEKYICELNKLMKN